MTLLEAGRLSEGLVAIACAQQALEHAAEARHRGRWLSEAAVAVALLAGVAPALTLGLLLAAALDTLRRFDGPYNGGSDRMRLLVLVGLWLARLLPAWAAVALGYVAVQLVLSYALAGWVKLANPAWRSGQALVDVFAFSIYPQSDALRGWARHPALLFSASWAMLAFESAFPLALVHPTALYLALGTALLFHVTNAVLFGLNRFVWAWLAGYPLLVWFQHAVSARLE